MAAQPIPKNQEALRENEKKWSKPLMQAGWTALPSVLLERQQALGLDAVDICILMHLAKHWWYADQLPFPGKRSIATCMGIDPRTVQRRIAAMEHDGLIKRIPRTHAKYGQRTNEYDFKGLIKEATPFALEAIEEKAKRQEEHRAKLKRKRPLLRLVED